MGLAFFCFIMKKVSRIWLWLFLVLLGYSGGIVTGVKVDVDTVYHTTVKKLKQRNSPGSNINVDVKPQPPEKTKKEIRKERRDARKEKRQMKKTDLSGWSKVKIFCSPDSMTYICFMETLATEKRRGDYVHHLVKRNEHVAIYDTTMADGEIIGYEVFIIRKQEPKTMTMAGHKIELKEKELFPTDEMFGSMAYAPQTRERAEYYFDLLTGKIEMAQRGVCLN